MQGSCDNTVQHGCTAGSFEEYTDSSTHYRWRCLGLHGGAKSGVCSIAISSVTVGLCDNTARNGCTAGTPDDAAVADTSTLHKWRCSGSDGGIDSGICSILKSSLIVGSCNNLVRDGCTAGTANDDVIADTSTHYKWRCDGGNGGAKLWDLSDSQDLVYCWFLR